MILAHIAGVPVEETLPTLAGASTLVFAVRVQLMMRLRRRREIQK